MALVSVISFLQGEEFSVSLSQLKTYKAWSVKNAKATLELVNEIFTLIKVFIEVMYIFFNCRNGNCTRGHDSFQH